MAQPDHLGGVREPRRRKPHRSPPHDNRRRLRDHPQPAFGTPGRDLHAGGQAAALGFSLDVDAMRIELSPLDLSGAAVQDYLSSPPWRWQAFFRTVAADPGLTAVANPFQRDWLALIYLTAFSLAGLSRPAARPGTCCTRRRILARRSPADPPGPVPR